MKPFAVFKNGKFTTFRLTAGANNARFRVELWLKMNNGEKIEHTITSKQSLKFQDLLTHTIEPSIDELLNEATEEINSFGFNCYLWG